MSAVKNLSIRLSAVGGDKVRQEFKNLGNDGDKAFRRITQVITPANDNLKALDATARSFNEVIRQGTALFGAYLGFQGLKNTFSSIFNANTTFERLSASLKTVTGSTKAAQEAFTLIEKFAINTPYQLNEIVEAFIRLKALGLDPSEEALTSYGNTASAFSKNMIDFVEAVADATVGEFERLKTFGIKARDLSFSDFANSIISDMMQIAIRQSITTPLLTGISSYFGFAMAHSGGVIGADNLASKSVNPAVFIGAPKFHSGGLVGDEVPIIAKRGETIFTKGQMQALGGELNRKTPVNVNVNVHNNASGTKAYATSNQDNDGNVSIDVIIEQIESTIGKNISKGEGLSPILEQRYALNPAYGSYR